MIRFIGDVMSFNNVCIASKRYNLFLVLECGKAAISSIILYYIRFLNIRCFTTSVVSPGDVKTDDERGYSYNGHVESMDEGS